MFIRRLIAYGRIMLQGRKNPKVLSPRRRKPAGHGPDAESGAKRKSLLVLFFRKEQSSLPFLMVTDLPSLHGHQNILAPRPAKG
jgi:hypothetical protein